MKLALESRGARRSSMDRPKEGEYYIHRALNERIFITAVGIRNVLATAQGSDGIYEEKYTFRQLMELYEKEEA